MGTVLLFVRHLTGYLIDRPNYLLINLRSICHPECRDLVPVPCIVVQIATPRGATPGLLADYAPLEAPMIPALVVHCAQEVESRGLNEQGIYRVPGYAFGAAIRGKL